MNYVSISSIRGERKIKLHKAGANALLNAIDVLETIKDNLSCQSPLGGDGGPIDQAVMAIKATVGSFQVESATPKARQDIPGQKKLFPDTTAIPGGGSADTLGEKFHGRA